MGNFFFCFAQTSDQRWKCQKMLPFPPQEMPTCRFRWSTFRGASRGSYHGLTIPFGPKHNCHLHLEQPCLPSVLRPLLIPSPGTHGLTKHTAQFPFSTRDTPDSSSRGALAAAPSPCPELCGASQGWGRFGGGRSPRVPPISAAAALRPVHLAELHVVQQAMGRQHDDLPLTVKHPVVHQEVPAVLQTAFLIQTPVTHRERPFCSPSKTATLQRETERVIKRVNLQEMHNYWKHYKKKKQKHRSVFIGALYAKQPISFIPSVTANTALLPPDTRTSEDSQRCQAQSTRTSWTPTTSSPRIQRAESC